MESQVPKRQPLKKWNPKWKDKYMESTFRNIVTDELKRVRQTSTNSAKNDTRRASEKEDSDMLWEYEAPAELANEDYVELMLAMERALYDDMQAELRAQEEALLEEFEAAASQEDDAIADLIQNFQDLSADGVLCPLCKKTQLKQIKTVIVCSCGDFRLDTKDDQIGLKFLQTRLADVHQQHADSGCLLQPTFSIEDQFGIPALYMRCSKCESFQCVL
uniref:RPA-interacting protein C-terminal domain-containing protein n=1 Tax=Physcomitrium patens TaxID=3218 RepID=A0A7I4BSP1_PHYPA